MPHHDESFSDDGDQPQGRSGGSAVHIPTVMMSVGLSALACALVLVVGAVVLVAVGLPDRSAKADDSATVLDLSAGAGGGATPTAKAGSTRKTTSKRAAPTTSRAAAPAQGGSGSRGGSAPAPAAAGDDGGQAAPAPEQEAPAEDPGAEPAQQGTAQPSGDELDSAVHTAMDSGANRGERAATLEAGERGLGVLDAIDGVIKASGYGFTFKVLDPVRVDGDTAHATLQMSVAGNGSRNQDLTWVWVDGRWKLSNGSVCALAGLALLPCSL